MILVIDNSGSMSGTKLKAAQSAAKSVLNTLSNNDFIGIIAFNGTSTYLRNRTLIRSTGRIIE